MKNRISIVAFIIFLFSLYTVSQEKCFAQVNHSATVLSFEAGYFYPRRGKFRDFYGEGFPAISARVDLDFIGTTRLSIKGRFLKMSEFDELKYTNISLGALIKKNFYQTTIVCFYVAAGPQFEMRNIGHPEVIVDPGLDPFTFQREYYPSVALESGIDAWMSNWFRLSPNIGFTYFPLGDPQTGKFGDTGGFYFILGFGFRL